MPLPYLVPVDHDPFDPLAASAGVSPPGTPRIDQINWGQPSWLEQAAALNKARTLGLRPSNAEIDFAANMLAPGSTKAVGAAEDVVKGIRAYHGSPHDFERFDMSNIGTGEGAQAYGHGLYFAENPNVAASYKHSTTDLKDWPVVGGNPDWRVPSWVGKTASSSPRGLDMMIEEFSNRAVQMKAESHWNAEGIQKIVDALNAVKTGKAELKRPGHQYEVNINANPEHFLDYDKKVRDMPVELQNKLANLGVNINGPDQGLLGSQILQRITNDQPRPFGTPGVGGYNPASAAKQLRDAGIPGVKYFDQGSRGGMGQGTHNYVVFDDKLVDIIKKYGIAGLIAGGAAHFSTKPVDYDPFQ